MKHTFFTRAAVCLTTLFLPLAPVAASQLNWDNYAGTTYTSASGYSSDYIIDGMMVNVTVGGATANFVPTVAGGSVQTPAVANNVQGGTTGPENSLVIGGDFNNTAQFFSVTVTFRTLGGALLPVTGVNFNLFDVDRGNATGTPNTYDWVDRVSGIQATLGANTTISPTAVLGTAGGNTVLNNVITGAGNIANTGAGSNGANVGINFGSQALTSFTFNYGSAITAETNNPSLAQADPVRQIIALHDISFVPEPGTNALIAATGLFAGVFFFRRHRLPTSP